MILIDFVNNVEKKIQLLDRLLWGEKGMHFY